MPRLRSFATTLVAPLVVAALQGLDPHVGDPLPREPSHALADFTGTPATSFAHFTGRLVLLEFFAHSCVPCVDSVPHLNDLERRFGPRGLSVVGVADDAREETKAWAERHGVGYAWAHDDDGGLQRALGIGGIPYAVLIAPDGTIVWRGEPDQLHDGTIEEHLDGALTTPSWQWEESLSEARDAVAAGRLGAALASLRQGEAERDESLATAQQAISVLMRIGARERGRFEARLERGDLLGIDTEGPLLAGRWDGAPDMGQAIEAVQRAALEVPDRERILGGQRQVAEVRASRLRTRSDLTRAIERLRSIEERHPSDYAGVEARALREALELRLSGGSR
jgi:peroxiredoxin